LPKNQKNDSQIQGLIVFKGKLAQIKTREIIEEKKQQEVDQENKIKLLSELIPFGALYRYSILFVNESLAPITEIRARVKFPELLFLIRHYPLSIIFSTSKIGIDETQITFEIDSLDGNSKLQISLYFTLADINVKGEIMLSTSFINNKGFIRTLNVDPTILKLQPFRFEQKNIPSEEIGAFLRLEDMKKAVKSMGVGIKKKPNLDLFFNHATQLIKLHNFKLITKDEKNRIAWFFAHELESNEDILVISQIVSNKVEFLATSKDPSLLVSFLSNLSTDFKKSISSTGVVAIDQIFNLECKFCGNILPSFPKKGDSIECLKCNNEQVVW